MRIVKCDRCNKEMKEEEGFKIELKRERVFFVFLKRFELCESCANKFYKVFLKEQEE